MTPMTRPRSHRRLPPVLPLVAAATLVALTLGCAEPALPETVEGEGAEQPVETQTPDPARDSLVAHLTELRVAVAATRDELAEAMEAPNAAAGRRAGDRAVARLVDAPELEVGATGLDGELPPLFPSTTTERGSIDGADDLLTRTSTAARDAGGALGRSALELLRDPLAGDLGTWQQDPAGVVAAVRTTAASADDLPSLERAVLELSGEGTRALAWALLTADPPTPADVAAYSERGVTHLDLILAAVDGLLERLASAGATEDGT
jgi:hypothetical protein